MLRSAYLLTGDRQDAEDLVQGVLLAMLERGVDAIREDSVAYARRALINRYVNEYRRRPRTRAVLQRLAAGTGGFVPPVDAAVADREAVRRALEVLPPRQRATVVMRYFHDMSDAEIAGCLGCATSTVRSTLKRARASMRRHLIDTGAESPDRVAPNDERNSP